MWQNQPHVHIIFGHAKKILFQFSISQAIFILVTFSNSLCTILCYDGSTTISTCSLLSYALCLYLISILVMGHIRQTLIVSSQTSIIVRVTSKKEGRSNIMLQDRFLYVIFATSIHTDTGLCNIKQSGLLF